MVMRAPRAAFALLKARQGRSTWLRALIRPAIVWIVLGASLTIAATGHIAAGSFLPTLRWWSVVPIGQVIVAFSLVRGQAAREIGVPRALDLFFTGHAPWSLWLIVSAAYAAFTMPTRSTLMPIVAAAIVALVWTEVILVAYCQEILRLAPRDALRRTLLHQALTWGLSLALFGTAVQIVPRAIEWVGR
jgi:hypothetical protein